MLYIFKRTNSFKKGVTDVPMFKQVCIIPFRRDFLISYNNMDETILEKIESIDMMRILENGLNIKMVYTDMNPILLTLKKI